MFLEIIRELYWKSREHLSEFSEVSYCIVGHSERRSAGETDAMIKAKVKQLLTKNITQLFVLVKVMKFKKKVRQKNSSIHS